MDVAKTTAAMLEVKVKVQAMIRSGPQELGTYLVPIENAIDEAITWLSNPERHVPYDGVKRLYFNEVQ